ncbi:hypothetical protein [Gemmatimonas groenlandica]|uniref:Uncharacterized protein n=1 Tax=Gemmatimonas groenlandica TaxID=2732249 RepID=A0A6M4ITB7_9BACT|nr:hypothetical protein [Gemmatimonas groenlandica]QJR36777.1 hypothetical protein HKW67_15260 [Gemmatimonas groenlandica]
MIQFLADGIDQLDLALDQLAVQDRNFDRFALMLIDNVVELTLHRFAEDRASENGLWTTLGKPKYDQRVVDEALGQNFADKIRLAVKLALLSTVAGESILYLHAFRNTAYHRGLRHEGILHSLTLFYLTITCELLKAYKPRFWILSTSDVLSHRARKYLGELSGGHPEERFNAAYQRLFDVAASMKVNLISDLAADMESTVQRADDTIQFLADDAPESTSREGAVLRVQVWKLAASEQGRSYAKENGSRASNVFQLVEWLSKNYNWPVKNDPIPSWRKRVRRLRDERDPHKALKKYCDFMRQTDEIRRILHAAAAELDDHIESAIDHARRK